MSPSEFTAPEHADRLVLTPHAPQDVEYVRTSFGGWSPSYPKYWEREGSALRAFRIDRCISYFSAANVLGITPIEVRRVELGAYQFSQLTARRLLQKAIR